MFISADSENPKRIELEMNVKRDFTNSFWRVSNHSQPTWEIWKCATVQGRLSPRAFSQVEDILSIFCYLWRDKREVNSYYIGNVYIKYIMAAAGKTLQS